MALDKITLNDTFDNWRIRTNQLIDQSQNAFDTSIASFNYSNTAIDIAANATANILASNAYILSVVTSAVVANVGANAGNILASNVYIMTSITDAANVKAEQFFATNTLGIFSQTANLAFIHANNAYDQANISLSNSSVDYTYTGNLSLGDITLYSNGLVWML